MAQLYLTQDSSEPGDWTMGEDAEGVWIAVSKTLVVRIARMGDGAVSVSAHREDPGRERPLEDLDGFVVEPEEP